MYAQSPLPQSEINRTTWIIGLYGVVMVLFTMIMTGYHSIPIYLIFAGATLAVVVTCIRSKEWSNSAGLSAAWSRACSLASVTILLVGGLLSPLQFLSFQHLNDSWEEFLQVQGYLMAPILIYFLSPFIFGISILLKLLETNESDLRVVRRVIFYVRIGGLLGAAAFILASITYLLSGYMSDAIWLAELSSINVIVLVGTSIYAKRLQENWGHYGPR